MTVSDGVSASPPGGRSRFGPPLNPPLLFDAQVHMTDRLQTDKQADTSSRKQNAAATQNAKH